MIEPRATRERSRFAARVSMLFAAIFVVAGTNLPYLPVWLDWKGLSAREIAIVTALPLFVRVIVTPMIAFAADRAGDHRRFLIGLGWVGLAAQLALAQAQSFASILACIGVFALAWTTVMPLTETVAMGGVRAAGLDYGRMRVWGSVSFIAASFAGGAVVERFGAASAIWLVVAGAALVVAATHLLAAPLARPGLRATGTPRLGIGDAMGLLRSRAFLVFLGAIGAVQAAHAVFYTFGTLHWAAQGLPAAWSGALWAISVIAEVALFTQSQAVLRRMGPTLLIVVAAAAAVIRWLAMGFDPPLPALIVLQVLHALTFGAAHVGAIHYMGRTVPEGQSGTAQALYASVTGGLAMGGAMLAAGPLYATYGGRAYWAMALLALAGLAGSLLLWRMPPPPEVPSQASAQPQS